MWVNLLLKAILFALLIPGVVIRIPPHGSLATQAIVHGILFAVINYFVYRYIRPMLEGFESMPDTRQNPSCPPGYEQCPSGDCRLKTDFHTTCPK